MGESWAKSPCIVLLWINVSEIFGWWFFPCNKCWSPIQFHILVAMRLCSGGFQKKILAYGQTTPPTPGLAFWSQCPLDYCHVFIVKMPSIFTDPGWALLSTSILSMSNCGNPALRLFVFGPVVVDGYGIGYIIKEDGISVYGFFLSISMKYTFCSLPLGILP